MAETAVSFDSVTSTVAVGSIGGESVSGDYIISDGYVKVNNTAVANCASSMLTAYNVAAAAICTNNTAPSDLGGITLTPGVYCNAVGYYAISAGTLTLSGSATDVWIFQTTSSVTTASSTSVVLTGGALASNVFWKVGTTLTTGALSTFVGTVLAGTSITMGTSSTLYGRALAQAAVTCSSGNTITSFVSGYSAAPTMNPTLIPSMVPSVAPSMVPSVAPSLLPGTSYSPSTVPSIEPTTTPSVMPTRMPSVLPSAAASLTPSTTPTAVPSASPTFTPSAAPVITRAPTVVTLAIDLGDCAEFAVMASTAVSFNNDVSTVAVGSTGVSPGTSITGSYLLSSGSIEANTAAAISCAASMMTAYLAASATICTNTATPADLGGLTLTAGIYCNSGGFYVISADALTLHGSATDVWIFQAATSVTTAASTSIVMSGGALASNVFWKVGTTLTTGASSSFVGTVLAGTSITMGTSSTLIGRALAQAAVSLSGDNTVTSFIAGTVYSSSPTNSPSTTASSSVASSLSDGEISAIVIMSVVGIAGLSAAVYFGLIASAIPAASSALSTSEIALETV